MKIVELKINEDDSLGMEAVALVEQPAIEHDFFAFNETNIEDLIVTSIIKQELFKPENFVDRLPGESRDDYLGRCIPKLINEGYPDDQAIAICYESLSQEQVTEDTYNEEQFESYTDYPESAVNAARRALEWRDGHPEQECGTRVGWTRANQLANRQPISEETIARMASFARHLQYEDVPYSEGCGGLMVDAWGGRAGIEWAQNKLEEIREGLSKEEFKYFDDLPEDRQEAILQELEKVGITESQLQQEGYEIIDPDKDYFAVYKSDARPDRPTNEMSGKLKILYRYSGPLDDKNRKFCRRLLKLDLLFRKEDIDRLTIRGANEEFGYYDIFEYKGSFGCRHRWNKVFVYQPVQGQIKSTLSKQSFTTIGDQQVVVGPLMVPDKLILRVDEEGNPYYVYFSKETVRQISEKLMKQEKINVLNLEHSMEDIVQGYMMESWIIEDSNLDKSKIYGFNLPEGTWMAAYRITDSNVWEMVKEKKIKGFSIEGFFADRNVQN